MEVGGSSSPDPHCQCEHSPISEMPMHSHSHVAIAVKVWSNHSQVVPAQVLDTSNDTAWSNRSTSQSRAWLVSRLTEVHHLSMVRALPREERLETGIHLQAGSHPRCGNTLDSCTWCLNQPRAACSVPTYANWDSHQRPVGRILRSFARGTNQDQKGLCCEVGAMQEQPQGCAVHPRAVIPGHWPGPPLQVEQVILPAVLCCDCVQLSLEASSVLCVGFSRYDWGMRAIKSVLVVAGGDCDPTPPPVRFWLCCPRGLFDTAPALHIVPGFKRADTSLSEQAVLMRPTAGVATM